MASRQFALMAAVGVALAVATLLALPQTNTAAIPPEPWAYGAESLLTAGAGVGTYVLVRGPDRSRAV